MNQIGRKIYYDVATGNVLLETGEMSGDVAPTTLLQDFQMYTSLRGRAPDTVDYIQLEYGQYREDFAQCNAVRVNPATKQLEFSYPDPNQPEQPPVFQKPLTQQVSELKSENEQLNLQIIDLFEQLIVKGVL